MTLTPEKKKELFWFHAAVAARWMNAPGGCTTKAKHVSHLSHWA
jgi:hypothetical protein